MQFNSPESITVYLDDLVDSLRAEGVSEEADQLHGLLHESAWSTSSEWLGEIKLLLKRVGKHYGSSLSKTNAENIEAFILFVDEAWKAANR